MSIDNVLDDLKKKRYKNVYWLEGEEDFFIDEVMEFAESNILSPAEAGFNLHQFYGRDTDWATVFNACRGYPMFGERKVVLLKEAQTMRDVEKLEAYVTNALSSTILIVGYKGKKLDGRSKLAKALKSAGALVTTRKLYENELPEWTQKQVARKGLTITNKALYLLIDHIGNDLNRINNELTKVAVNLSYKKEITEDDIESFVGISKEYNVFELQDALAKKDLYKALRIAQYFESNPKAGPLQLIFPSLYSFFSKVHMTFFVAPSGDKGMATAIGVPDWKVKDYITAASRYGAQSVENNILLLHHYNLKSLGVNDPGTGDGQLLKELLVKMIRTPSA